MGLDEFMAEWRSPSPFVSVRTSGSTGAPKPMKAEKKRMEASAGITCRFLQLKRGDTALLCMPLDYIAGKMMVVRSLVCGLNLISVEPCGHPLAHVAEGQRIDFAAMVPMQVYNSLQVAEERERLTQIGNLIIGGGSIDSGMAAELRSFPNAVWSTYGMTETLSHIALRRLSGDGASEWYEPFEGVGLSLNASGCLVIDAPAVCAERLETHDMAELDGRRFKILGRLDNVICSGGIKIQAEEVERLLGAHTDQPFAITKREDAKFGEAVVLVAEGDTEALHRLCETVMPKYWVPQDYIGVAALPHTETGKIARKRLLEIAERHAGQSVAVGGRQG